MHARIAIVSQNQERAEALKQKFAEKGYSAAHYSPPLTAKALDASRGRLLVILDSSGGDVDASQFNALAKAAGAETLLLSELDRVNELENMLNAGADYCWPAEAVDELPDSLEALLSQSPSLPAPTPTQIKSVYLSASAMAHSERKESHAPDELAHRLAAAEKEIQRLHKEMESFTYSVSHDLRAPLRAIEGFTRILTEDFSGQLDAEGQKFLSYVVANSQHLGRLIDDLLVYHRLGKAPLAKSPLDMTELAREVLAEQRMLDKKARQKSPQVEAPALLPAQGDKNLIRQVWTQYLANALKFTREADQPRIEIGSRRENEENVYFVKDNGIGFDMQYAGKLFQVFQKLQRQDDYEGNGIGLAIAQRIVQRHGGRVWSQAAPGQGATFFFTLPRA